MKIKFCYFILVLLLLIWSYVILSNMVRNFTGGEGINFMPSILINNENRDFQTNFSRFPNRNTSRENRNVAMNTSSLARQQIKSQRGVSQLASANTLPSAGLTLLR